MMTSPCFSGKCVRFSVGRSRILFSAGFYQDFVTWHCSLLTRCTICGRTARNTPKTQKQPRNCTNSVVMLQDQCSYTVVTVTHDESAVGLVEMN